MNEPLVVVKGKPDDEELAAVVCAFAVVAARRPPEKTAAAVSRWRFGLRQGALPRGAGAWRAAIER